MGILGKPTLKQTLDALKNQVLVGKSYLDVAKGLLQADPVIIQTAPTFFGLTLDGSLELAQIAIARLYDRTRGTITMMAALWEAANQRDTFQRGDRTRINEAILTSARRLIGIQPIIDAIRRRRNEWLAHLDPRTVADPKALSAKAKLSIPDLELAFQETEETLLELSSLYEGIIGDLQFIGGDDYKNALNWIRMAKCVFIENFEKEFGAGSWTGPRPKYCSRKPYDMI